MEFSKKLREIRLEKGFKQREVAEHLGMKLRSYQFYEQGRVEPPIVKLIALAELFQVSLDELMGRNDQR